MLETPSAPRYAFGMAADPFKPLIVGMFSMGAISLATLGWLRVNEAQKQQEAEFARRAADQQRQFKEHEARFKAEAEARRKKAAEDDRRAAIEREAAAAKRKEALASRRQINVGLRVEMLREKAEQGDPESQYLMGWLYRFGTTGLGDFEPDGTARQLRPMVAGPVLGENLDGKLGQVRFVNFPELTRDEVRALSWFRRAALQGHDEAQHELAHHLSFDGEEQDLVESYKWYLLSRTSYFDPHDMVRTTRGLSEDGQIRYEAIPPGSRPYVPPGLLSRLTPEQKAEAEKRAKAFQPKKERP